MHGQARVWDRGTEGTEKFRLISLCRHHLKQMCSIVDDTGGAEWSKLYTTTVQKSYIMGRRGEWVE